MYAGNTHKNLSHLCRAKRRESAMPTFGGSASNANSANHDSDLSKSKRRESAMPVFSSSGSLTSSHLSSSATSVCGTEMSKPAARVIERPASATAAPPAARYVSVLLFVCVSVSVCVCECICVHVYVFVYAFVYIYIYIYTYACTHERP